MRNSSRTRMVREWSGYIIVLSKALGSAGFVPKQATIHGLESPSPWPVVLEEIPPLAWQPSRVWQSLDALG